MKKVYIVYSADAQLLYNSYNVLGIVDDIVVACLLLDMKIKEQCIKDYEDNSYDSWEQMYNDAIYSLKTIQQTQCFDENYVIEEYTINQI
jgi:hypothetical protein